MRNRGPLFVFQELPRRSPCITLARMRRTALAAGITVIALGASGCVLPAPRPGTTLTSRVTLSSSPTASASSLSAWPPTLPATSTSADAPVLAQPADDVTLPTSLAKGYGGYGPLEGDLTVVNHSTQRASYSITVSAQTADGSRQLSTGYVFVDNLEPGQTATKSLAFIDDFDPDAAVLVLQSVRRIPS